MDAIIDIKAREPSCDRIEERYVESVEERPNAEAITVGPVDMTSFMSWLKAEEIPTRELNIEVVSANND